MVKVNFFDHVHIYAADVQVSVAFYATHFGAERSGAMTGGEGGQLQLLRLGGQTLVIGPFPGQQRAAPVPKPLVGGGAYANGWGVAHLGLNVDDVPAAVEELQAAGVEVLAAPRRAGTLTFAYVAAPDGVIIELTGC